MNYKPHIDECNFIRAILAAPKDVAVVQAYSDWLADHGHQDRAEFINLNMKLEKLTNDTEDSELGIDCGRDVFREMSRIEAKINVLIAENDYLFEMNRLCGTLHFGIFRTIRCSYDEFLARAHLVFSTQAITNVWIDDVIFHNPSVRVWYPRIDETRKRHRYPDEVIPPQVSFMARWRCDGAFSELCLNYGRKCAGLEYLPTRDIIQKHAKRKSPIRR